MQYANWMTVALMADGEGQSGGLMGLFPLLVIFALFYFILIAPMRKKQKALQKMIEAKQGDGAASGSAAGEDDFFDDMEEDDFFDDMDEDE